MPIYEYRCASCGEELEKLQKISAPPLQECPACGKHTLVKRVSAASFRLKGSGWYETDFKTGKKKNGVADADTAAAAPSPDAKTEAKPQTDTKADNKPVGKSAATDKPSTSGTSAA